VAAFTEAMYLLGTGGWRDQEALWRLVGRGDLVLADLSAQQLDRARSLMEKYRDVPMDLADATLVALAEARSLRASSPSTATSRSIDSPAGARSRSCRRSAS
jgi:predicted nucleic acid-binding protein